METTERTTRSTLAPWFVTIAATATMAISYLDRQVLAVVAPTVRTALSIGDREYGWLQSAFSMAYLVFAPFAGAWLDRVGVRRGLVIAVVAWTLVSGLHAAAGGLASLFLLRVLLGAAESPSFPGAASAITRTQSPAHRARAIGILYTGSSLGAMLAPPIASYVAARWNYRAAFVVVALVGLVWVPLWWWATGHPEMREALARRDTTRTVPPSPRLMLRHHDVRRAAFMVAGAAPIFAFVLLWTPSFLHARYGVEQGDVGKYAMLPAILADIGAVAFGDLSSRWVRRRGERSEPRFLVWLAVPLALVLALAPFAPTPWLATIAIAIALAGGAGLFALLSSELMGSVGPFLASSAGGITAAVQSISYIVVNPLIGEGVARSGYHLVMPCVALWLIPCAIAWTWFGRGPRTHGDEAPSPS